MNANLPSGLRQPFYCKALQGESNYDICINADMTVSCNCQDYDGFGHIGDLQTETFEQIFRGKIAQRFREHLMVGLLPTPTCRRCGELTPTDSRLREHHLRHYRLPHEGIMVENTSACNLRCVACRRGELVAIRKRLSMSLDDMEKAARIVRDLDVRCVFFFNLGEPFLSPTVFEELRILRKHNPNIFLVSSTNGALVKGDDKQKAALLTDWIMFSIDGTTQDTLSRYQVGGRFEHAYRNMRELVIRRNGAGQTTPLIEWKYVVFAWNDSKEQILTAIDMARAAHVDALSFWLGGGPAEIVSKRFTTDPFFQTLGVPFSHWRRLVLTPNGERTSPGDVAPTAVAKETPS